MARRDESEVSARTQTFGWARRGSRAPPPLPDETWGMSRAPLLSLAAAAAVLVPATGAAAATVERQPAPEAARTFATGAPGWTSSVSRGGLVCLPPIVCPVVDRDFRPSGGTGGAGDGFIRTRAAQLAAVAATATGIWRSPAFTPAGPVDRATLGFALRSDVDGLIAVNPDVDLRVVLADVADPSRDVAVLQRPLWDTAGFTRVSATLPAGAVVPGRAYRLELRTRLAALAAVPLAVTTDFDDVELQLIDAEAPSGLTATVPPGAPRVTGSVDPHGQATSVTVDFGLTDAYGDSAGPVVVDGDGAQPFTIPLAHLTPGQTYHYRVTAENLDGSIATADATFVAPVPPLDAPPMVTGPLSSRSRDVTYDPGAGVTSAEIEIRGPGLATPIVVDDRPRSARPRSPSRTRTAPTRCASCGTAPGRPRAPTSRWCSTARRRRSPASACRSRPRSRPIPSAR